MLRFFRQKQFEAAQTTKKVPKVLLRSGTFGKMYQKYQKYQKQMNGLTETIKWITFFFNIALVYVICSKV